LIRYSTDIWPVDETEYYFDTEAADLIVEFFETTITHVEGDLTGEPVVLAPHWKRILREIFGWKSRKTHLRKYKFVDLFVPRKNFKSGIIAGVMLYLTALERPKARKQNYIVAPTELQSKDTFRLCKLMCEQNEWLAEKFECTEEYIQFRKNKSILRFLSGAPRGKTGKNTAGLLWEEWQEITSQTLVSSMETSIISRAEPLIFKIGTGGDNPDENLPGYKEWCIARRVVEGKLDLPDHYIFFCEAPEGTAVDDFAVAEAVNPGWGTSVNEETLRTVIKKADGDPAAIAQVLQFHYNIWVKKTSQFISIPHWNACYDDTFVESMMHGRECWGGLDLGGKFDMTAFTLWFPSWVFEKDETGDYIARASYHFLPFFWIPEACVEDAVKHGIPYNKWQEMGQLVVTKGDTADYPLIRKTIASMKRRFKILGIGYDPKYAQEMAQYLKDNDKITMVSVTQTLGNLNEPTEKFIEMVQTRDITHNNNEVMLWNLECARQFVGANEERMVTTKHSRGENGRGKVDGVSAAINGLRLAISAPAPKKKREIFVVGGAS